MVTALIVIGALVAFFSLLNLKTSRPDGQYMGKIHPYRKLMLYIMPTRNESYVLYDDYVEVEALLDYIKQANERFHVDLTHCIVGGLAHAMKRCPSMNRFVVGHRLYQRNDIWITFSMQRQKLGRKAKLSAVKRMVPKDQSFYDFVQGLNERINVERSDQKTYLDKELGLLSKIPRPVLKLGVKLLRGLDYYGLLPGSFIKNDAMYTSMFSANLGSLGMGAGYHHLYEWGTCPLFLMVGTIEDRAVVVDGQIVVKKVMPLRFTYDERIDTGLNAGFGIKGAVDALESPHETFGCLAKDGSEDYPIGEPPGKDLGYDEEGGKKATSHAAA